MARLTKKKVREIWNSTSRCYTRALKEEYPVLFQDVVEADLDEEGQDQEMRIHVKRAKLPDRSESINARYLKFLLQMPSETLNLIIEANNKGKISRAQHTIDAIMNELLARQIIPDTKDSNEF